MKLEWEGAETGKRPNQTNPDEEGAGVGGGAWEEYEEREGEGKEERRNGRGGERGAKAFYGKQFPIPH